MTVEGTYARSMTVFGYSFGHVLNDMTASLWFSVLLLFLRDAVNMDAQNAGIVMFAGQIADGIATPLVGVGSDGSVCFPRWGMGRRKAWNAGGVVLVALCFTFIYAICLACEGGEASGVWQTVYYSAMASLFNFGWAAVQVSHMSMVPELTPSALGQTTLNAARYAMTILSNVAEFCALWALLHWLPGASQYDIRVYRYLAYGTVVVGLAATALFLVFTPSPENLSRRSQAPPKASRGARRPEATRDSINSDLEETDDGGADDAEVGALLSKGGAEEDGAGDGDGAGRESPKFGSRAGGVPRKGSIQSWSEWFQREDLYVVGANYMFTRLLVNVAQVYLSFYVTVTLRLDSRAIAISPLVMYLSSLASTSLVRHLTSRIGRQWTYAWGTVLCMASSVGFLVLRKGPDAEWIVYVCAGVLGFGSGLVMVTAVSFEADLVAKNTSTGAFVYGILSLTDKISNGIVILVIQIVDNRLCDTSVMSEDFYRNILAYIPLGSAVLGCVAAFLVPLVAGHRCSACARVSTEDEARQERIIE
jgi:Na+/melibiose symporter-like transporter